MSPYNPRVAMVMPDSPILIPNIWPIPTPPIPKIGDALADTDTKQHFARINFGSDDGNHDSRRLLYVHTRQSRVRRNTVKCCVKTIAPRL